MRRVSRRPEGENAVSDAAILHRTMNRLRGNGLIPRGVYRFHDHEEADEWMIGGFAVILHGFVRATKDVDLLVDASIENVQRLKRAMAALPDNAIALMSDDEVERYGVVRVADEFVVDLMKSACGIHYDEASEHIDQRDIDGVIIPVADKELLIGVRETVRKLREALRT